MCAYIILLLYYIKLLPYVCAYFFELRYGCKIVDRARLAFKLGTINLYWIHTYTYTYIYVC